MAFGVFRRAPPILRPRLVAFTKAGGTTFPQAVDDTLGLTETLTRSVQKVSGLAETAVLTEALARLTATVEGETAQLTEDQAVRVNKALTDATAFVENLATQVVRLKDVADTVGLTEDQRVQVGKQLADTVQFVETLVRNIARGQAEAVSLAETLTPALVGGVIAGIQRFRIITSLDAPAAAFQIDLADLSLYLAPNEALRYALEVGLINAGGSEVLVGQLRQGVILERDLIGTADSVVVRVTGRDAMDAALRTQVRRRYVLNWRPAPVATLGPNEEPDDVEELVGPWTAKTIAESLAALAGLALFWDVDNYTMRDTFEAQGTVYDLVRQLGEAWSHPLAEPFLVDVFTSDGTLIVTQAGVTLTPDTTLTVQASRLTNLRLRRVRLPLVGRVEIEGMEVSTHLNEEVDPTTGVPDYEGGDDPDNEEVNRQPVTLTVTKQIRDKNGELVGIVEVTTTWRMPDRLPEKILTRKWERADLGKPWEQVAYTEQVNTWEASEYGPQGPLNHPQLLGSETRAWTLEVVNSLVPENDGAGTPTGNTVGVSTKELIETEREVHGVSLHAVTRFWTAEVRTKSRRKVVQVQSGTGPLVTTLSAFLPTEQETKDYEINALPGYTRVVTTRTTYDDKGLPTGSTVDQQLISGLPPGGIRPPRPRGGASDIRDFEGTQQGTPVDDAEMKPIRIVETISNDPTAIPVRIRVPHFNEAECLRLLAQFQASSGLYRYALEADGPIVPWLAKARVLELTDFFAPDGVTEIPMAPARLRDLDIVYDEGSETAEATVRLGARWYDDT